MQIYLTSAALIAIGAEAWQQPSYGGYSKPSYGQSYGQSYGSYQHRPQQYQYYQPYYQAYSYGHANASVPTGWYSATQQFRPIAIPYVACKESETVYAKCAYGITEANKTAGTNRLTLDLVQVPGQPIQVDFTEVAGGAALTATDNGSKVTYTIREYGCDNYLLADLEKNPEWNPIEEKQPDGTGAMSFQDTTRGRISISKVIDGAKTNTNTLWVASIPRQTNLLQNLCGLDGILGRCITANIQGQTIPNPPTATTIQYCTVQRSAPPADYANPKYTPNHHHIYPQMYNRYPSFPRYNNYSKGGVW